MRYLGRDTRGNTAVEFAIAAPIMAMLILGVLQIGLYGVANAGIKQSVDEAARVAILYPRPSDAAIQNAILQKTFGIATQNLSISLTHGVQNGGAYVDISAKYTVPSVGLGLPSLVLAEKRRAFQN